MIWYSTKSSRVGFSRGCTAPCTAQGHRPWKNLVEKDLGSDKVRQPALKVALGCELSTGRPQPI